LDKFLKWTAIYEFGHDSKTTLDEMQLSTQPFRALR
jgi:hypothetical protein